MAEDQQNGIFAPFPAPPPFYRHFTPDNLAQHAQLQQDGSLARESTEVATKTEDGSKSLTEESSSALDFLTPPKPPTSGTWNVFGVEYNLETKIRSLEENGIERLYPEAPNGTPLPRKNHAQLVTHIVRSILLNFLELADVLNKDAKDSADKINELQTLFFNAHHLLNEYRPHQARETLIGLMEQRIASMRADIQDVKDMETKVNVVIEGLGETSDVSTEVADMKKQAADRDAQKQLEITRSIWEAMNAIE